jgi:hypothetical protein
MDEGRRNLEHTLEAVCVFWVESLATIDTTETTGATKALKPRRAAFHSGLYSGVLNCGEAQEHAAASLRDKRRLSGYWQCLL